MGIPAWISKLRRDRCVNCADFDCTVGRRLWRSLPWCNVNIRLQGSSYCAPQCFEAAARDHLARICRIVTPVRPPQHRIPLGLLMLSRGQLTNRQLRQALEAQQSGGNHRLGEWLEKLGFATEEQVTAALGLQWACPVLTGRVNLGPCSTSRLPYRLLEAFRMLPLQFVEATRTFYLAFSRGIDYSVLYAIEQMLECRTEACLASRSTVDEALEKLGSERGAGDLLFEGWREAAEMARITCSYVLKLGAQDVRIVGCREYVWARLTADREVAHLLFRRPAPEAASLPFRASLPLARLSV